MISPDPRDQSWGDPPLPPWVTSFRPSQLDAVEEIVENIDNGVRFNILDAPTGTGKTLIGEMVRRQIGGARRGIYVCTTKTLQDQFAADFPYAKVLKGRANYPTLDHPHLFNDRFKPLTAGDCTKRKTELPACSGCDMGEITEEKVLHCENCHPWYRCPYEQAKIQAIQHPLAVTNTAYFLGESNSVGRIADKRDLTIVDECDTLESILMGQVEVSLSARFRKKYDIDVPQQKTKPESWLEWCEYEALPKIGRAIEKMQNPRTVDEIKELRTLNNALHRLSIMHSQMTDEHGVGWIYSGMDDDGFKARKRSSRADEENCEFKPVRVDAVAGDFVWQHGKNWLLMSGTIIDPHEFVESLGITEEWALVKVPNVFPAENRPVHIAPVASMTNKEKETAWPLMVEGIAAVCRLHPDERVLVHTVSYAFTQYVFDVLRKTDLMKRLVVYSGARDREQALDLYKSIEGSVLLGPSMDRGVDLPGDLCRVQVICKVPFLNLGDPQVKARLYSMGGERWYAVQTVRTLVQMCGRGVRSKDDHCHTYILDTQFVTNLWNKSKMLLPGWFKDAFNWSGKDRLTMAANATDPGGPGG